LGLLVVLKDCFGRQNSRLPQSGFRLFVLWGWGSWSGTAGEERIFSGKNYLPGFEGAPEIDVMKERGLRSS
jgi:hypothetical protein